MVLPHGQHRDEKLSVEKEHNERGSGRTQVGRDRPRANTRTIRIAVTQTTEHRQSSFLLSFHVTLSMRVWRDSVSDSKRHSACSRIASRYRSVRSAIERRATQPRNHALGHVISNVSRPRRTPSIPPTPSGSAFSRAAPFLVVIYFRLAPPPRRLLLGWVLRRRGDRSHGRRRRR